MAEHTPGPWSYIEPAGHYREPLDYIVGTTEGWGQTVARINPCDQSEANARLMAAAPELLAALEACRAVLWDQCRASASALAVNAQAVAAIAKARGEAANAC